MPQRLDVGKPMLKRQETSCTIKQFEINSHLQICSNQREVMLMPLYTAAVPKALSFLVLSVLLAPACSALQFDNGSFENPPVPPHGGVTLSTGSSALAPWTVTSGTVDWIDFVGNATASTGTWFLDLSGAGAGTIEQTFDTIPGTEYTVTFDMNANTSNGAVGIKTILVTAPGMSQAYTYDGSAANSTGPWITNTLTFTATDAQSTLSFASLTQSAYGPLLDNVTITGSPNCAVSDLTPITDVDAEQFESSAPFTPQYSLFSPYVSIALDTDMAALQSAIVSRFGTQRARTSGFRPPAYQSHLYELRTKLSQLNTAIGNDPSQATACSALLNTLNYEIDVKHRLVRNPGGLPTVNPPQASAHTQNPSQAIDLSLNGLSINQLIQVDFLASLNGLSRPCSSDSVHFVLSGGVCTQAIRAEAHSPVAILITDPAGKRVGFDTKASVTINEIGPTAFYSGLTSEPQFIDISSLLPGTYTLTAVGTSAGAYTLVLDRVDDDGAVLQHQEMTGTADVSVSIPPLAASIPLNVSIDIQPGQTPNTLNPKSMGTIPVAILSSAKFNAPQSINETSLTFGATGAEASLAFCNPGGVDVNGDGLPDLICHFRTIDSRFTMQSTQGTLRGKTITGIPVAGIDWVNITSK
jgi:choice-of-anchor C domain-containing protein